jgi:hypothetical protein
MADPIVTRNRKQYLASMEQLRRQDLLAAKKKRKAQLFLEQRIAAELNKKHLLEPKTISRESYLSNKRKTQGQFLRSINAKTASKKSRSMGHITKKRKKRKKRSVWTVSGGAFESNRQRH